MNDNNSKFLIQAKNNMEADFIISVLESNNISAYKQYEATGSYLNITAGYNFQGTNIFVSDECLDDAKTIIDEIDLEKLDAEQSDKELGIEEEYNNKRRNLGRLMLWMIIIPVIIIVLIQMKEIL